MKNTKGLIIGITVFLGVVLLVSMTYVIPLFLLGTTESGSQTHSTTAEPVPSNPTPDTTSNTPENPEEPGPVIVLKPYHQTITSQGKPEFEIRASEALIDQKNNKFTLNIIEAIRFFSENGEEIVVAADSGIWQQKSNRIDISGNVEGKILREGEEPVNISCQWLKYDQDKRVLVGGSDVVITHEYYRVTAEKLILKPEINHLELQTKVVATIGVKALENQSIPLNDPVIITADNLVYNGEHNVVQFSGIPVVKSGVNEIHSRVIQLRMDHDNTVLNFDGNCRMFLDIPSDSSTDTSLPATIKAEKAHLDMAAGELRFTKNIYFLQGSRELRASDRVSLMMDPDSRKLFGGSASGNVRFGDSGFAGAAEDVSWDPTAGIVLMSNNAILDNLKDVKVFGDQIQLYVSDRFYVVDGNARIEMSNRPDTEQSLDSEHSIPVVDADLEQTQNHQQDLQESSSRKEPVNLLSRFQPGKDDQKSPMILRTQKIEVDEQEGRMLCQGGVDGEQGTFRFSSKIMELQFDPRTREIISLTAKENISMSDADQVLTGGRFHYMTTTGTAEVWEDPVMWKGDGQIRADRFVYNENTGILQMIGNVDAVTVLPEDSSETTPKNVKAKESDRFIYLTSGNGSYDQINESIEFQDDVKMRWGVWKTQSNSMRMTLDPKTGELRDANALGDVQVHHEQFVATGHSLTYTPETSILILRGTTDNKCQVTQGERGSQGDEIRFFINENRFVIENGMSVIMPSEMTGTLK